MCNKFDLNLIDCVPGTIAFDAIVDFLMDEGERRAWSLKAALIFGVIFRFSRLKGKRCFARQDTIAQNAYCTDRTFRRHIIRLIEHGLVIDQNPGLRNKPHNYTVTELAYSILAEDLEIGDSSDILSKTTSDSSDILSIDSSDILSDEEEDEEEEFKSIINKEVDLAMYIADFSFPSPGQIKQIQKWVDDPLISNLWIDAAIAQTVAAQPERPFPYLAALMRDYMTNSGPGQAPPGGGQGQPQRRRTGGPRVFDEADRTGSIFEIVSSPEYQAALGERLASPTDEPTPTTPAPSPRAIEARERARQGQRRQLAHQVADDWPVPVVGIGADDISREIPPRTARPGAGRQPDQASRLAAIAERQRIETTEIETLREFL